MSVINITVKTLIWCLFLLAYTWQYRKIVCETETYCYSGIFSFFLIKILQNLDVISLNLITNIVKKKHNNPCPYPNPEATN